MKQDFPFRKIMLPNGICLYANKHVQNKLTDPIPTQRPWLFVHGMWSDASVFYYWLLLAEAMGIPAYAIDLRGRGNSNPSMLANSGIMDYVQDVLAALSYIGRECVLIGHSMGALISQVVAYQNAWVKKLILVTSAPPAGILLRGPLLARIWKYMPSIIRKKPFTLTGKDLREIAFNSGFSSDDQDMHINQLVPESGKAAHDISFWKVWVKPIGRCNTVVISGGRDRLTPTSIQEAIAHKHTARHLKFPDGCHMLQLQPKVREQVFDQMVSWAN